MPLEMPRREPCPFCEYLNGTEPCAFIYRDDAISSFVNRTQYEHGALLIAPNHHYQSIIDIDEAVFTRLYLAARRHANALIDGFGATGVNIYQNSGISAGQTVPHFHIHVVPRYGLNDPGKRFREAEFEPSPLEDLEMVARQIENRMR